MFEQEYGTRVPWQFSSTLPHHNPSSLWPINSSHFGIITLGIEYFLEHQPNCLCSSPFEEKVNKEEIRLYWKPNSRREPVHLLNMLSCLILMDNFMSNDCYLYFKMRNGSAEKIICWDLQSWNRLSWNLYMHMFDSQSLLLRYITLPRYKDRTG